VIILSDASLTFFFSNDMKSVREKIVFDICGGAFTEARESLGLSEKELAVLACLSSQQICQIENGKTDSFYTPEMKVSSARKVSKILGLSDDLAFRSSAMAQIPAQLATGTTSDAGIARPKGYQRAATFSRALSLVASTIKQSIKIRGDEAGTTSTRKKQIFKRLPLWLMGSIGLAFFFMLAYRANDADSQRVVVTTELSSAAQVTPASAHLVQPPVNAVNMTTVSATPTRDPSTPELGGSIPTD
jgi:transcriptional regulator with XRE-family HTH domain